MFYDAFRDFGGPTIYPALKTAVTVDVLEVGIIFAVLIVAISFFLVVPGVRGRERIFFTIRWVVGLFVVACILLCNFGQEWEVARVTSMDVQYRAGLKQEMHGDLEIKVGLRSINITLKGDPVEQSFDNGKVVETINYNERFGWDNSGWSLGRFGFGPFAGKFNQAYREAQMKGLPYPILWVAEFFTLDGEGVRWGRYYLQAGFYTHLMLWMAFPLWVLAMILYKMVLRYGAYFSLLTGLCLITANLIFAFLRNPLALSVVFNKDEDKILKFGVWGSTFWLNLFNGIICVIIGVVTLVMDIFASQMLATFFNRDITQDFEEFYIDPADLQLMVEEAAKKKSKFNKLSVFKSRRRTQKPNPPSIATSAGLDETSEMTNIRRKGTIDFKENNNPSTPQNQTTHGSADEDEIYAMDDPNEEGRTRADSSALRMYRRRTAFDMVTPLPPPRTSRSPDYKAEVPLPTAVPRMASHDESSDEDGDYVNANTAAGPGVRFQGHTNVGFTK